MSINCKDLIIYEISKNVSYYRHRYILLGRVNVVGTNGQTPSCSNYEYLSACNPFQLVESSIFLNLVSPFIIIGVSGA